MSNKFNEPWTHRERIELLVNVLQGTHQDLVPYLVHIIQDSRLVPQWTDIALPEGPSACLPSPSHFRGLLSNQRMAMLTSTGRSLRDCQLLFDSLIQQRPPPQSFTTLQPSLSASFPSAAAQHRPFPEQPHFQPQPTPRAIQPRPSRSTDSPIPASTNGDGLTIVRTVGPDLTGERRKKRGRPTKEEVEERTAMLAAEGKVYEPKKRPIKKFRASTGTPIPLSERTPPSPAVQTPLPQTVEAKEDSSSGKRRSKRQSIGLQTQGEPASPTTRTGDEKAAESPSDRLLARFNPQEREPDRIIFPPANTDAPVP